ncbi:MAG: hypothetical protein MJY97_08915 [Bacteroidales bacterium]|nr:hypothetical protein [Bacteroidales bacterium]
MKRIVFAIFSLCLFSACSKNDMPEQDCLFPGLFLCDSIPAIQSGASSYVLRIDRTRDIRHDDSYMKLRTLQMNLKGSKDNEYEKWKLKHIREYNRVKDLDRHSKVVYYSFDSIKVFANKTIEGKAAGSDITELCRIQLNRKAQFSYPDCSPIDNPDTSKTISIHEFISKHYLYNETRIIVPQLYDIDGSIIEYAFEIYGEDDWTYGGKRHMIARTNQGYTPF